jgi:hypothetical protein
MLEVMFLGSQFRTLRRARQKVRVLDYDYSFSKSLRKEKRYPDIWWLSHLGTMVEINAPHFSIQLNSYWKFIVEDSSSSSLFTKGSIEFTFQSTSQVYTKKMTG